MYYIERGEPIIKQSMLDVAQRLSFLTPKVSIKLR